MKAPHKYAAKNGVGHYFRKHFYLTTSGNFSTPAMMNAVAEMGVDRVMFSVDWPFEAVDEGANGSTRPRSAKPSAARSAATTRSSCSS